MSETRQDRIRTRIYGEDRPQTEETRLWDGLRELSDRLVRVIEYASPSSPILVSGDWGAGKSSLLAVTRDRLATSGHLTVWFGAWNYEGEGALLPSLLRALWQHAPPDLQSSRADKKRRDKLLKHAKWAAKKVPEGALLLAAALWHQHYLHLLAPFAQMHGPEKAGDEDSVKVVHEEFRHLIEQLKERTGNRPVIFFIDDLDRCNPLEALNLIESLRILIGGNEGSGLEPPDARYVVALDRTALIRAVTQKFDGMNAYDGNRYLEKIFPISFQLPQPQGADIHQFVQGFLESDCEGGREPIGDNEKDILGLALVDPIFANPRLMKRCIERFRLVLEFETEYSTEDSASIAGGDQDDQSYEQLFLAKWIAAGERWPSLRRLFSRHTDEYWLQIQAHLSDGASRLPDEEALQLIAEQDLGGWLRRELFGSKGTRLEAYRRAERRLRRLGL